MSRGKSDLNASMETPAQRLVQLACALFHAPIGLMSVLGEEETVFRAVTGMDLSPLANDVSVTQVLVAAGPGAIMVVEDGPNDDRVRDHPLVTGTPWLRFYAGATVSDRNNRPVGSIGVMSTEPRGPLSEAEMANLKRIAEMAGDLVDQAADARASAEKLETLQLAETMAGVGNFRFDVATGAVSWSDEVFRIHGLEPGSVDPTLHSAIGAYHPDDAAIVRAMLTRAIETGEGYDAQLRLTRADGDERVTRSIARCERDEEGVVTAVFGVFQDITDSVRDREQQAEMLETLKLAGTVAGVGHWRWDVETDVVTWSDVVYEIHGQDPAYEPNLESVAAAYQPEDRARLHAMIEHALATGEGYESQFRIRRPDGEERVTHAKALCEMGPDGRVQALFGVTQDVTEEVRSHEAVTASEARYRLLADNATDIIVCYGVDGRITYVSPAVEAATGRAPESLLGLPATDFVHPEDVPAVSETFREMVNADPGTPTRNMVYRGVGPIGSQRWFEARTAIVRDAEGRAVEFQDVVRDITETKRLEEALIAARDTAEAGARSKSEFLANMSHELRTPLTSVIGFSGLLQASADLPETARKYADRIATASDALLSVINDILDYSKLEADAVGLDSQPLNPRALAASTSSMVEGQCLRKGLTLVVDVDPELPSHVMGDEGRLGQVMLNFLSNAVKFTARGEVRLAISRRGDSLRVAVSDTGIGIPADKINDVFERFTQGDSSTTRVYGGTGLGLAISRRLIEMMGGQVGLESRPGEGSTFWFEVPLTEVCRIEEVGEVADLNLPEGLRILMADDVAANRELGAAIMGALGIALDAVADGSEAVEAARDGGYDLILMDVHMPVMDGLEATRAIRGMDGEAGEVPIVALTANVQPGHIERCREAGMDGHVGKPIQLGELVAALNDALANGRAKRRADAA